jgi:RNA polymerase sigma factor (sigma-70 family)
MENEKLIRKIAWSFHHTTNIDVEDLFQEGCLAYFKALQSHDQSKAMVSTHIYHCVSNHLINYCKKEHRYKKVFCEIELGKSKNFFAEPFFESLSKDAILVAEEVLRLTPDFLKGKKVAQKTVYNKFRKQGWKKDEINKTFSEIKVAFS